MSIKKDLEDIKVIHKKCVSIISSCEHLIHIRAASTYFELAQARFKTLYPDVPAYKNHNILLANIVKHIDMLLVLKRMQLRSR